MNWTELEIFQGIDLNDSFVMGWSQSDGNLSFELEASIWPGSKFCTEPKENENTCYRKAILSFEGADSIQGLKPIYTVASSTDPDGTVDYGNIDSLSLTSGGFEIEGDFGSVIIKGGKLNFEICT